MTPRCRCSQIARRRNKKFRFGSEERSVGDAGRFEISLRFLRNTARVAIVRLASDRIDDSANQTQCRFGVENIDPRSGRIRNDEHVRGVDHAPAANARSVKPKAISENLLVVFGERGREMLPGAEQIREFEIDQLHVAFFDHFADVGWSFVFGHIEELLVDS